MEKDSGEELIETPTMQSDGGDSTPLVPKEFQNLTLSGDEDDEDEGDSVPPPIFRISKVEQYNTLKSKLLAQGWSVDERALDRDILHVSRDENSYALYLFFGDERESAWLADEKPFNDSCPLWFSSTSHVVSPDYLLDEYIETLGDAANQIYFIVVLMYPTYIINVDHEVEEWYPPHVFVSFKRLQTIIDSGAQLDFETSFNDISNSQCVDDAEVEAVESITELSEIAQCKEQTETEDSEDSEDSEEPSGELTMSWQLEDITVEDVKFCVTYQGDDSDPTPSASTYFRTVESGVFNSWVTIKGEPDPKAEFKFEIRAGRTMVVAEAKGELTANSTTYMPIAAYSLPSGSYSFVISHGDTELFSKKITIVDIKAPYTESIELTGFGFYRMQDGDDGSYEKAMDRRSQSCFMREGLVGVLSTPLFKNLQTKDLPFQFIITVEDEKGQQIYQEEQTGSFSAGEEQAVVKELPSSLFTEGCYVYRVEFYGEVVTEIEFVIGDRDIRTSYNINKIQRRLSADGKGVIKSEKKSDQDPMALLQSMVGLTSIKKQLSKSIAKIRMDRAREAQGLPVKAQQLHLAFLGNPGTGKTTVAKLLGQIYKEIGVLSKGHVVVEDRSTLMSQSWGSEGELVNAAISKAQGGILFIDEAYDLVTEHKNDPGKLIISTLLTAMADENKRDFMVIFAGYTQPMEILLSKNPGLRSRLTKMHFEDYNRDELMQIADIWLTKNKYTLTSDARKYLASIMAIAYASRSENFGNGRYVNNLLENEVQPAMAERLMSDCDAEYSVEMLTTIEACDIPNYHAEMEGAEDAIARLEKMIGLNDLKSKIRSHLSYIRFVQARRENKIDTPIPPLHMVFTGNPGTGKTSVAEYLGDIYHSMGLLSMGNVMKVSRADMIDDVVGGTEAKMKNLITAAQGNILFIDEAYTLFDGDKGSFGKIAVETLLDALGKEQVDMIVVLAGYPKEMEQMLNMNPGLKGRFPYHFTFEDYDVDELFAIAESIISRNNLTLTQEASDAILAMIRKECKVKDGNFSNARFVSRLITTQVLPNMAMRLEGETDPEKLCLVQQCDVPIESKEVKMINENLFDEALLADALQRLDSMVGLTQVKGALHQFVDFVRAVSKSDPAQIERYPLKWHFVGNSGTGKSSIAEILSQILKAMNLLGKGHTVEINAEEIYNVPTYKADELIQQRMRESLQGLLFVDGDAPQFKPSNGNFNPDYLRISLATNTNEIHGRFAVVIAEQDSPRIGLARRLNKIGISNFDHTLIFEDYTAEELFEILHMQLKGVGLTFESDAADIMRGYIATLCRDHRGDLATARTMKILSYSIHKVVLLSGATSTISAASLADFTKIEPSAPQRKKIGY